MKTIVMLTSDSILAVCGSARAGKIKVKQTARFELPAGTVVNGKIADSDAAADSLIRMQRENPKLFKNVNLVIDSNLIFTKVLEVPKIKEVKLHEIAKNEYRYMDTAFDQMIFDYRELASGSPILCCAVEKAFIESYLDVFRQAKIKIANIDTSLSSLINTVNAWENLHEKTFILLALMDGFVTSALFSKGVFAFANRLPLLSARESDALGSELLQKISSILYFNKAQQNPDEVSAVYFCGLTQKELEASASVGRILDIESGKLEGITVSAPKGAKLEYADDIYLYGMLYKKG